VASPFVHVLLTLHAQGVMQEKGSCSLATFQALAAAVWDKLSPLVLEQQADATVAFRDTDKPTTLYLSLHRL
jgi:hypothetical protein